LEVFGVLIRFSLFGYAPIGAEKDYKKPEDTGLIS
jgi:hypothetical protein